MKNDMCECKCKRENQIISELHIYTNVVYVFV